ncbi:MAG: CHAT domain-containing protein [Anaerolineales bacterium]
MVDYVNFELQVDALAEGFYRVRVLDAPQDLGDEVPAHDFRPPYDDKTMQRILWILSGERRPKGITHEQTARQFGEALFGAVFAGPVYQAYQDARIYAAREGVGLRFRLNLGRAGRLASLPWEFLRDPNVDFLALSRQTPLVRYNEQLVNLQRLQSDLPLRVMVMISAPEGLPAVDEASERRNMLRATANLRDQGLVELTFVEDASLRTLQRELRQGEYHVFHYIGHGYYDEKTEVGTLILEDPVQHREPYPVRGEELARELHEEQTLRLVVLNTCHGAAHDVRDPFSGVASSLVKRGIPAVVAQQFEITDQAAIAFSEEFYRAVAEGMALEAAVAEGRRAIATTLQNTEWATPVLFLYSGESHTIFNFPEIREPTLVERVLPPARRVPLLLSGAIAVVVVLLMFLAGAFGDQDAVGMAPPTATPIPNVDLVVSDVQISPRNPRPGEFVSVFVEVQNQGTDDAPPFAVEWQPSIASPGGVVTAQAGGLAAGGVLRQTLTARFGWWGLFISQARVDPENVLIEPQEQNSRTAPVRTTTTQPFIIDFDEALPNGELVRQNQPVPFDLFAPWGFRIEAQAPDNPLCTNVVPWFRFIGISRVALTTGLPSDPNQCTDAQLVILFDAERPDTNPAGVSGLAVDFPPGSGLYTLTTYQDVAGTVQYGFESGANDPVRGLTLETSPNVAGFGRVFRAEIDTGGAPLRVTELRLQAP